MSVWGIDLDICVWLDEDKKGEEVIPLLHFVETGKKGDRDEDDDCFFAVTDFELLGLKIY